MILSDIDIKQAIKAKEIIIDPLPDETQYGSSSLNLIVGNEFKKWNPALLGSGGTKPSHQILINFMDFNYSTFSKNYLIDVPLESDGSIILAPNDFMLILSREYVELPREGLLAARVEGRSTMARLGFTAHLSAPTIHAGFGGNITLEVKNFGPFHIKLTPGKDQICQLIFEKVQSIAEKTNSTIFQGQKSVTGTK